MVGVTGFEPAIQDKQHPASNEDTGQEAGHYTKYTITPERLLERWSTLPLKVDVEIARLAPSPCSGGGSLAVALRLRPGNALPRRLGNKRRMGYSHGSYRRLREPTRLRQGRMERRTQTIPRVLVPWTGDPRRRNSPHRLGQHPRPRMIAMLLTGFAVWPAEYRFDRLL